MLFEQVRQRCQHIAVELVYLQIAWWLVIRQPVKSFPVIRATSVRIFPAEPFVHVIRRECGRRPVVSVGAGLGIHEEPVKQTESSRKGTMVWRHHLPRAVRPLRSGSAPENCKIGLSIRGVPIARCLHVAKNLVVGAILLDDVDHVLDGALPGKQFRGRKSHQAVILQGLLRVARQSGRVRKRNDADVSRNNRPAVLPALPVLFFIRRKRGVGWIRSPPAVVHAHRGRFESRSFSISDE